MHPEAVADLAISDAVTFASLPLALACCIFVALPPDARGRAACVCRAWRDTLADPSLWTRLEMERFRAYERYVSVLHGAAARARGQLLYLDLSEQGASWDVLLPVLTANAGSLRELRLFHDFDSDVPRPPTIAEVMAAAPLLQVLTDEDLTCTWEDAPRLLRGEPPFALLQLQRTLFVLSQGERRLVRGMERIGPLAAALSDATLQPSLLQLCLYRADTADAAVMGALADAAVARRLPELSLHNCAPPAAAPLARLLTEGSLADLDFLEVWPDDEARPLVPAFDAAGAALVADALRVNTTLTHVNFCCAELCADVRVACTLLGALVGHPRLRHLEITGEDTPEEHRDAFGAALGALIAADAPALQVLDCSDCSLGDDGLAPIVQALPLNCHLRELSVADNGMIEELAREQLLPAVRANTTLRKLTCGHYPRNPAAVEAEELVRRRAQHV